MQSAVEKALAKKASDRWQSVRELEKALLPFALVGGRFVLEGGGQPEHSGWFSTIWERQSAGWRVIHDHSS